MSSLGPETRRDTLALVTRPIQEVRMTASANEGQEPQGTSTTSGQGQEPPANTGQGQEPPAGGDQFDPSTIQDPAVKAYLEQVQRDAQEARTQAARYRTERNTLNEQVTAAQRANETEAQRVQREQQEREQETERLREENRDLRVGTAVREAAITLKAFNPQTVWAMVRDRVQLDDKGNAANVDDLLTDLRKTDPYLFKRGTTTEAGEGGGPVQVQTMNDAIRRVTGHAG